MDSAVDYICSKASIRLYALRTLTRSGLSVKDLCSVYCCFIRPVLEYTCAVWHSSLPLKLRDQLEQVQRRAVKIILPSFSYVEGLVELNIDTLFERREFLCRKFYKSVLKQENRIHDLLPNPLKKSYSLRHPRTFPLIKCRTKRFKNSFIPYSIRCWDAFL